MKFETINQAEKYRNKVVKDANSGKFVSPLKAIRAFCLECMGYQAGEIKDCQGNTGNDCPLYKFRFGRNTTRKKIKMTEQQKEALKRRFTGQSS